MSLTTTETAIALVTRLGFKVFPWVMTKDERKVPLTENGHLDSVGAEDIEQIATWFSDSKARIGVHVGASGLLVGDVDVKEGKDGFQSTSGWLDFPSTFEAETGTGGKHFIYQAPPGVRLAPSGNFQGFRGLDIRGGSSWIAWWADEVPEDRSVFAPAPAWMCEPAKEVVGGAFEGGLDDWLSSLEDVAGEPNDRVLDAIQRIPDRDFGRFDLLERQFEFVRLAAEGAPGVLHGLNLLREAWLTPAWGDFDTDDNRYTFDKGLDGAIHKAGALDQQIANLPKYSDLYLAASQPVENALASKDGVTKSERHWFNTIKVLIRAGYEDSEVASLLWSAPATKGHSREWGIEFVFARIAELRAEVEAQEAKAEAEVARDSGDESTLEQRSDSIKPSLLTADEREALQENPNFIHRYLAYAGDRFPMLNAPYHRANAWTILSLTVGTCGFSPLAGKNLGLNLFQLTLGESSTGKSDSLLLRDEILRRYFEDDGDYDLGVEASGEMAHEHLLGRDGKPTFFHADEAAVFFRELTRPGSWQAKLQDKLTDFYGGYVGPVHKRAYKGENKGGHCHLVSQFFGTPDRLFGVMETDQFLSGFLARFQWSIGEPASKENRTVEDMQDDAPVVHVTNPQTEDLVTQLQSTVAYLGHRRPFKAGRSELARLLAAEKPMEAYLRANSDWKITESAYRRLVDALRKCAALLAGSRGSVHISAEDVLGTLEQAEVWLAGLVEAASNVSSSAFEREARDIAMAVKAKAHPWITEAALYKSFSRYEPIEFDKRLSWGVRSGYIQRSETNHGTKYGWRGHQDDDAD